MVDVWSYSCRIWILKREERKSLCFISEQHKVKAVILCRFSFFYKARNLHWRFLWQQGRMQRHFLAAPGLAMLPTILKTLSAWEKKKILSLYPLYIHHWHIIIFSILKLLILLFLWETHQSNTNIFSNFLFKYNQGHIIHSLCGNIYICI